MPEPWTEGGVQTHALARSLRSMTLGSIRAFDELQRQAARDGLAEVDQQFQVPISGKVGELPMWSQVRVKFGQAFLVGPSFRAGELTEPTFTFGYRVTTGDPLVCSCSVRSYEIEEVFYYGALLDVGVFRPGAAKRTAFAGELHFNFQGFASQQSDDDHMPDDTDPEGSDT